MWLSTSSSMDDGSIPVSRTTEESNTSAVSQCHHNQHRLAIGTARNAHRPCDTSTQDHIEFVANVQHRKKNLDTVKCIKFLHGNYNMENQLVE
jgi:hypothetical protein